MSKIHSGDMYDEAELRERLSPEEFEITQHAATERAFTGRYWDVWDDGTYHCVVCDEALFTSETKFDAGCGWPSFDRAISDDKVGEIEDRSFGMRRVESVCGKCGAHLGHVFPDGPTETGLRYCMNSASLRLAAEPDV
ncbi:MAG: peptide-methionine (R)-S-oxide reductase MsrB [Acidimicrobiales bacterium]